MSHAHAKRLCIVFSMLLSFACAAAISLPVLLPISETGVLQEGPRSPQAKRAGPSKVDPQTAESIVASFASSVAKPMQRPLRDPPKVETEQVEAPKPPPPPRIGIVLVGTAVSSNEVESRAWIQAAGDKQQMLRIGDIIKGVQPESRLKEILQLKIVVEVAGHTQEFQRQD